MSAFLSMVCFVASVCFCYVLGLSSIMYRQRLCPGWAGSGYGQGIVAHPSGGLLAPAGGCWWVGRWLLHRCCLCAFALLCRWGGRGPLLGAVFRCVVFCCVVVCIVKNVCLSVSQSVCLSVSLSLVIIITTIIIIIITISVCLLA